MAQSLANLRKKNEKFNMLAEKEIESQLASITNVSEARLIAASFPKLGIKSKKIFEYIGNMIATNAKNFNINNVETLMIEGMNNSVFPKGYYEALGKRLSELFESRKESMGKPKEQTLITVLRKWETNGLYKNPELITRIQNHLQLL